MSLSRALGGILLIICGIIVFGLSFFIIPFLVFRGTIFGAYTAIVYMIIMYVAAGSLGVIGIYYAILGLAEGVKNIPTKYEYKVPEKIKEVVQKAETETAEAVEKIVKIIICPSCNHENSESANFCESCGNKLRG